jgi:hypothetical protein
MRPIFPTDNAYGIPRLDPASLSAAPAWLAPYGQRLQSQQPPTDGAIHFFLDDDRFERAWTRPQKTLSRLQSYAPLTTVLTPDFSLYRDRPLAEQLWAVYRNRWCGALWQRAGLTVIPTVSWSTAASYAFCFAGVPPRSVVAVSTVGVRLDHALERHLFVAGFRELVARVQPPRVLSYGEIPPECASLAAVRTYPTRWTTIRAARRRARLRACEEQTDESATNPLEGDG